MPPSHSPAFTDATLLEDAAAAVFLDPQDEALLFDAGRSCTRRLRQSAAGFFDALNAQLSAIADFATPGAYIRRYMRHAVDRSLTPESDMKDYAAVLIDRTSALYGDGWNAMTKNQRDTLKKRCKKQIELATTVGNRENMLETALALRMDSAALNRLFADCFAIAPLDWRCAQEAALAHVLDHPAQDAPHALYTRWKRLTDLMRSRAEPIQPAPLPTQDVSRLISALLDRLNAEQAAISALRDEADDAAFVRAYRAYRQDWALCPPAANTLFAFCYHCFVQAMHDALCQRQLYMPAPPLQNTGVIGGHAPRYLHGFPAAHTEDAAGAVPYYKPAEVERFLYPFIPYVRQRDSSSHALREGSILHEALHSARLTSDKISKYLSGSYRPPKSAIETLLFAHYHLLAGMPQDVGNAQRAQYASRYFRMQQAGADAHPQQESALASISGFRVTVDQLLAMANMGTIRSTCPYDFFLLTLSLSKEQPPLEDFYKVYEHSYALFYPAALVEKTQTESLLALLAQPGAKPMLWGIERARIAGREELRAVHALRLLENGQIDYAVHDLYALRRSGSPKARLRRQQRLAKEQLSNALHAQQADSKQVSWFRLSDHAHVDMRMEADGPAIPLYVHLVQQLRRAHPQAGFPVRTIEREER